MAVFVSRKASARWGTGGEGECEDSVSGRGEGRTTLFLWAFGVVGVLALCWWWRGEHYGGADLWLLEIKGQSGATQHVSGLWTPSLVALRSGQARTPSPREASGVARWEIPPAALCPGAAAGGGFFLGELGASHSGADGTAFPPHSGPAGVVEECLTSELPEKRTVCNFTLDKLGTALEV